MSNVKTLELSGANTPLWLLHSLSLDLNHIKPNLPFLPDTFSLLLLLSASL